MRQRTRTTRRGAVLAEALMCIIPFVLAIVGMVDVAVATMRANSLAAAARYGARQAAVHGEYAPQRAVGQWSGRWTPQTGTGNYPGQNPYTVRANQANDPIVNSMTPYLIAHFADSVTITVTWYDPISGNLAVDNRVGTLVRVTLTSEHRGSIAKILFDTPPIQLSAMATVLVEH
jgi:Flp pilus assembly protein TadG